MQLLQIIAIFSFLIILSFVMTMIYELVESYKIQKAAAQVSGNV